jgi:cytoskeletal protein CcmA (bactofilin family)
MFETKKSEIVVNEGAAETIVGTSVKLKGNLKSDGDIIVDGVVAGEIKTKGSVKIGKNANIIANIKAKNVSVSGVVQGSIDVSDRLEILETGKVLGDVNSNVLSIAAGAVFSGKSQMNDTHKEVADEPTAELEVSEEEINEEKK